MLLFFVVLFWGWGLLVFVLFFVGGGVCFVGGGYGNEREITHDECFVTEMNEKLLKMIVLPRKLTITKVR